MKREDCPYRRLLSSFEGLDRTTKTKQTNKSRNSEFAILTVMFTFSDPQTSPVFLVLGLLDSEQDLKLKHLCPQELRTLTSEPHVADNSKLNFSAFLII